MGAVTFSLETGTESIAHQETWLYCIFLREKKYHATKKDFYKSRSGISCCVPIMQTTVFCISCTWFMCHLAAAQHSDFHDAIRYQISLIYCVCLVWSWPESCCFFQPSELLAWLIIVPYASSSLLGLFLLRQILLGCIIYCQVYNFLE